MPLRIACELSNTIGQVESATDMETLRAGEPTYPKSAYCPVRIIITRKAPRLT